MRWVIALSMSMRMWNSNPAAWDIKLSGPWTEGRISVPYDFRGDQPVDLNMERLLLIEPQFGDADADNASSGDETDPRDIPPIKGKVRDFVLGNLRLGQAGYRS